MSIQEVTKTVYIDNDDGDFWRYEITWLILNEKAFVRVYKTTPTVDGEKFLTEQASFEVDKPQRQGGFQTAILYNMPTGFGEWTVLDECQKHRVKSKI